VLNHNGISRGHAICSKSEFRSLEYKSLIYGSMERSVEMWSAFSVTGSTCPMSIPSILDPNNTTLFFLNLCHMHEMNSPLQALSLQGNSFGLTNRTKAYEGGLANLTFC